MKVPGPWIGYYDVTCVVNADLNNDNRDDLILCNGKGQVNIFIQRVNGTFRRMSLPPSANLDRWRNVRMGRIIRKKRPSMVVTGDTKEGGHFVHVFQPIPGPRCYDFEKPSYSASLPHAAPDLEILDVNSDGLNDVYIVQNDESSGYCATKQQQMRQYWNGTAEKKSNPKAWVPPVDAAVDILLVREGGAGVAFREVAMNRDLRGCGTFARRFKPKGSSSPQLVLGNGDASHPGYHYQLEWNPPQTAEHSSDPASFSDTEREVPSSPPTLPENQTNLTNRVRN